ncbi:hypothetical protein [Chamaesiphon sp.]
MPEQNREQRLKPLLVLRSPPMRTEYCTNDRIFQTLSIALSLSKFITKK